MYHSWYKMDIAWSMIINSYFLSAYCIFLCRAVNHFNATECTAIIFLYNQGRLNLSLYRDTLLLIIRAKDLFVVGIDGLVNNKLPWRSNVKLFSHFRAGLPIITFTLLGAYNESHVFTISQNQFKIISLTEWQYVLWITLLKCELLMVILNISVN